MLIKIYMVWIIYRRWYDNVYWCMWCL